jgi:hypothetical protein
MKGIKIRGAWWPYPIEALWWSTRGRGRGRQSSWGTMGLRRCHREPEACARPPNTSYYCELPSSQSVLKSFTMFPPWGSATFSCFDRTFRSYYADFFFGKWYVFVCLTFAAYCAAPSHPSCYCFLSMRVGSSGVILVATSTSMTWRKTTRQCGLYMGG